MNFKKNLEKEIDIELKVAIDKVRNRVLRKRLKKALISVGQLKNVIDTIEKVDLFRNLDKLNTSEVEDIRKEIKNVYYWICDGLKIMESQNELEIK